MEAHIDDMISKGTNHQQHIENHEVVFDRLRAHNMRLNPQNAHLGPSGEIPWLYAHAPGNRSSP